MKVKISIITPTYNRSLLIPRMIKSVLDQSYTNWELIIVDDGSTDNTKDVIARIQDDRIKYFYTDNSGSADSRNYGVAQASSDFIIFLDSDDEAKPEWLEVLLNTAEESNATIVSCAAEKIDHNGNISLIIPENQGPLLNNVVTQYLSGTLMMKKLYFLDAGGYDPLITSGQHTELLIRLLPVFEKNNAEIISIYEPLVIIHVHQGVRIRHDLNAIYNGSTRTLAKHKSLFLKNKDKYHDYLSVAALCAFKTNRVVEGKELLVQAWNLKPFNVRSNVRLLIGYFPIIRKRYWKNNL